MKPLTVLSLNIWGGRKSEQLLPFLEVNRSKVDIFCFQNVYKTNVSPKIKSYDGCIFDIHNLIDIVLESHQGFHYPTIENVDTPNDQFSCSTSYGLSTFVKKSLPILEEDQIFVYKRYNDLTQQGIIENAPRNLAWMTIGDKEDCISIANLHGLWSGLTGSDSTEQKAQSRRVRGFLDALNNPYLLCGDFNLSRNTESFRTLAKDRLDLNEKYQINNTHHSNSVGENRCTDYMIGHLVKETSFKVLPDEISSHPALLTTIEVETQ